MIKLGKTEKLIFYILHRKESMPTGEIIGLLAKIGSSESAVRASLFRLRKKRFIRSVQKGRETFFSLAVSGIELVRNYKDRLEIAEKKWNGKWLLFSFNIPEKKRSLRNKLRNELMYLGFGRLHSNLWISPYSIQEKCEKVIERLEVKDYTAMFVTDYVEGDPKLLSSRAWNLEKLSKRYQQLTDKYYKQYQEFKRSNFDDPSQWALEALVRVLKLKEELIELGMKDPLLPKELLPDDWPGLDLKKIVSNYLHFLYRKSSPLISVDFESKEYLSQEV